MCAVRRTLFRYMERIPIIVSFLNFIIIVHTVSRKNVWERWGSGVLPWGLKAGGWGPPTEFQPMNFMLPSILLPTLGSFPLIY